MNNNNKPDFDTPRSPSEDSSVFKAFIEGEGDLGNAITLHEDGTITITGTLSANDVLGMLHQAMSDIQTYMRARPLPPSILQSDLPPRPPDYDPRDEIPF